MKYLITGANGQLGQEWEQFLHRSGTSFVSYASSQLDITNSEQVEEILFTDKPDVVVNCAAYTHVDLAEKEREKAYNVNGNGVGILADTCQQMGAKLIHYSTDYVFDGRASDEKRYPDGYPEDAAISPLNVYGRSKAEGEKKIIERMDNYLIVRVSWLCGARGGNFVKTMLRLAETHKDIRVVDDQIGSPAFAFDVVQKSMALIESGQMGVFHCSSEGRLSWADFAEAIFRISEKKTTVHRISSSEYKTDAKRPEFSLLSKHKLKQAGLQPLDWQTGLRDLLRELE